MVVGQMAWRMATKDCHIACRHWFEGWNSIAIAMFMVLILSVSVATSTQFVRVEINCRHHCGKFSIQLLLPSLHCAVEVLLGDRWVGECKAMHCLLMFRYCMWLQRRSYGWLLLVFNLLSVVGDCC